MSNQEKNLVEKLEKLPKELQQRFSDTLNGAVMALEQQKPDERKPA